MVRRIMLGVLAVALPVGLLAVVVAPNLAAASPAKTGTGTYKCTKITGTITFTPPLTLTSMGTVKETTKISASSSGCSGGSPAVKSDKGTETEVATGKGDGNCSSLSTTKGNTTDLTVAYTNGASNSTLKGTAKGGTAKNGDEEFVIKNATVTGSYASKTADVTAVLSQTESQIAAQCGKSAGLKTLTIASGTSSNS
jgi:hypothetical protein